MNRTMLTAVVISGLSLAVSAQKPAGETVSVRGCVERAQRDGSLSVSPSGTTATPNTAPAEANSGEMVNAFRLKDATPVSDSAATGRTEYALQGNGAELAKHVGHQVEIAGSLLPSVAEQQADKAKPAEGIRRVQVTGVKMVASKCSVKP
jgi:hypothetical protein